ncbi:hypothetical protein [Persicitalea sp.]
MRSFTTDYYLPLRSSSEYQVSSMLPGNWSIPAPNFEKYYVVLL